MGIVHKIKFILIVGISSLGFGQEISTQLPVLSPQSPTTADLGKYGEVQVNESTGTISPSIPLFEYNAGKMNIPITLSYSGNGVRVNQDPTWAGINWNLNPGGIITREVRDEIDELTLFENRKYYSAQALDSLSGARAFMNAQIGLVYNPNTTWYQTITNIAYSDNIDSETDVFSYNFLGYSGSFYLDKNNKAHLIKYDKEIAITFSLLADNKSSIMIQTPEGHIYTFGGPTASESSRTWALKGSGSRVGSDYAQNAFYLNTISFLTGGIVNFKYEQYGSNDCSSKIDYQETATLRSFNSCLKSGVVINSEVESLIKLERISNTINNQIIDFDTSTLNNCAGIYQLNSVFLKTVSTTGAETILKKIKLNYLTIYKEIVSSKNKFFLQKVEFFNKNNQYEYNYEMTYNSPELLPMKFSFAQDELGYYNGKDTNTTLLPDHTWLKSYCGELGDREAFLQYSLYGSLSQIKYPTGGSTWFEYELPYKGNKQVYSEHRIFAKYRDPNSGYSSSSSYPYNLGPFVIYYDDYYPDDGDANLIVTSPIVIRAVLNATVMGSITHHSRVAVYAIKTSLNQPEQKYLIGDYNFVNTDNDTRNYSRPFSYTLSPGSYKFRIEIKRHDSAVGNSILANVQLELPAFSRDVFYPGLRIKKVTNNNNNSNVETTRYYYNTISDLNIESYKFNPNYINNLHMISDPANSTSPLVLVPILNSSSVANFDTLLYENITVSYGGDNFENGGKSMRFFIYGDRSADEYYLGKIRSVAGQVNFSNDVNVGTNDISYQKSVLREEYFYDKNKKKIKETVYNYQGSVNKIANNIKPYLLVPFSGLPQIDNYVYLLYQTKSFKYRLLSTITKEYFSGVIDPLVTTTTQTFAADKVSLPSTIETTNSANEVKKVKMYYPSDIAIIGNLTPDDAASIPILTTKHNLAEIIKTESFVNNELLESKQVSFKNFGGKILPRFIKTKNGSNPATPFEDRVVFDNYNFYSNPLIVSMKDGMKTQYVYNSKQQVIVKIENLNSTFSIADRVSPTTPCFYQNEYPNAMVTSYTYDDNTNNLISVTDPKCNKITYTYDDYGRLLYIRDKDNNILSENLYHFKQ
ncbi:RHS repeat domain-containing protein [Flavobacterium sp.]|uniref:RHS repeat domain-containing protein n=1 Tax=Flavobacterium sp. TaxID=239 RepID=UPI00286E9B56|nr:RHS repeat domain-containing protein [Flavobacterium sp.]